MVSFFLPVDTRDDGILRKRRRQIIPPDGMVRFMAFMWLSECVIYSGHNQEDVGDESCDLVQQDGLAGVFLSTSKWVYCSKERVSMPVQYKGASRGRRGSARQGAYAKQRLYVWQLVPFGLLGWSNA